jgi:hypothetical protein
MPVPTIDVKLKLADLPSWDGEHDTAVKYFFDVSQKASLGGMIPELLGQWLGMRLEEGSAVQAWYAGLPGDKQSEMRRHYIFFLQAIKEHYLGRVWQRKMNREYEMQRFRQRGHDTEMPRGYLGRRIMWTRMLVVADEGGPGEVHHVMEKAPISWGPILILENIDSTITLYSKVVEHELALVNAWKSETSKALTTDSLGASLKALGYSSERPRFAAKQVHYNAGETTTEGDEVEDVESPVSENPAEDEVFRQVYSTLKAKRHTEPSGGYPVPKNDHVVTKLGKLPPGPCRLCGSEKHWNRECPNYVVYSESVKRNANLVSTTEPTEEDTMYQSLFTVLLNQTLAKGSIDFSSLGGSFFDQAALKDTLSEYTT